MVCAECAQYRVWIPPCTDAAAHADGECFQVLWLDKPLVGAWVVVQQELTPVEAQPAPATEILATVLCDYRFAAMGQQVAQFAAVRHPLVAALALPAVPHAALQAFNGRYLLLPTAVGSADAQDRVRRQVGLAAAALQRWPQPVQQLAGGGYSPIAAAELVAECLVVSAVHPKVFMRAVGNGVCLF